MEADAVDNAIMLDNTELRGRPIKVGALIVDSHNQDTAGHRLCVMAQHRLACS